MISVAIETTSRCNLQCVMCGNPVMTRPKIDMSYGLFVKIVDDIVAHGYGLHQLHLMGEPLMDRKFEHRLVYLADLGVPVQSSFSTNCVLLTPQKTDSILAAGFCEVHRNSRVVRLCIDSMDSAVYDRLRLGGNLALAIENAKYFIERVKGRVDNLQIQRLVTDLNPSEPLSDFDEFGIPVRTQKVGLHQDKSRDLRCRKDKSDRRKDCKLLYNDLLWVAADGRVTGCCLDCDFQQPFGDLNTQTISETLEERDKQRRQYSKGEYDRLDQCNICYGNDCTGRW